MNVKPRPKPASERKWRNRFLRPLQLIQANFHSTRGQVWAAYIIAVLSVALATSLRLALDPFLAEHHPFTLYFAAVAITAWYGGLGPGTTAIVLSYFAADWFFITPRFELNWPRQNLDEFLALILFLFSGFAIAITSKIMRRALSQAREKQKSLEHEIAERQKTQEALQHAQEQLRQHAQLLEDRVAERTAYLQETIRSLEGVCYHIAHDLRAALRAMNGFTTLLVREYGSKLDSDGQHYANQIAQSAQRMDLLIHGLLEYGRLGHEHFSIRRLALAPILTRVLSEFADDIARSGAQIEIGDCQAEVLGNEVLLVVTLQNLLSNALKFVRPGITPQLRLWVDNHEGFARLCIEDNGIGVPSDYAKKAFGIFERLHPAQQYPGTGMGLAIAAKAVERMKGRLGVDPNIVEGSRFWLELPQVSGETIPQISRPGRKREEKLEPNLSANGEVLFSAEA